MSGQELKKYCGNGMIKKIENSFKDLIYSLHMARLYGITHQKFMASVDTVYNDLQDIFKEKEEIVIGIVGDELAFEKEIFFELSKIAKPIIGHLREIKIEKIAFLRAIEKEELRKFLIFIISHKGEQNKFPQECLESMGIHNITVSKIGLPPEVSIREDDVEMDYLFLYNDALGKFSNTVDRVLNKEEIDYLSLKLIVNNVMDNLTNQYQELLKLATIKRYDARTFSHILNVSILAMHFSSKLGFPKDDAMEIGIAALFHDIGKLYISRAIINKPSKLTEKEFIKMKSHVVLGTEILLQYVDKIGILPIAVAFEHHVRYDLKGYPKLPIPRKPNIASLIVAICDVYDALSQKRSYKNDYSPDMIYSIMSKDKNTAFEPQLLDSFFKIMGVWPIGTVVLLADNSIAVVRQENEEDIFCPKVEVISPKEKKMMLDLKKLKGEIGIVHYLNPFNEGKEYLKFV